jgi:hypothetical protein
LWLGWWTPFVLVLLLLVYGALPVAILFTLLRYSTRSKAAVWIIALNFIVLCLITSLGGPGPGFFFLPAVLCVIMAAVVYTFAPLDDRALVRQTA